MTLSDHSDLKLSVTSLVLLDVRYDGCESVMSDVFGRIKETGKSLGKGSVDLLDKNIKIATSGIIKTLGTRRMFLGHLGSRLNKEELKDESILTESLLKKITSNGDVSDIIPSLDELQKTMDILKDYILDMENYIYARSRLIEGIKGIINTKDAVNFVDDLDRMRIPVLKLPIHKGNSSVSNELPGGKFILFNEINNKAILMNEIIASEENTESFVKQDVKSILIKLSKLTETYQFVVKALDKYLTYVKKSNTLVGASFAQLDTLKGTVSASLLANLRSHLEEDTTAFSFYTGFLPKVIIYLDDYVDTLSSYLSKQFN